MFPTAVKLPSRVKKFLSLQTTLYSTRNLRYGILKKHGLFLPKHILNFRCSYGVFILTKNCLPKKPHFFSVPIFARLFLACDFFLCMRIAYFASTNTVTETLSTLRDIVFVGISLHIFVRIFMPNFQTPISLLSTILNEKSYVELGQ